MDAGGLAGPVTLAYRDSRLRGRDERGWNAIPAPNELHIDPAWVMGLLDRLTTAKR